MEKYLLLLCLIKACTASSECDESSGSTNNDAVTSCNGDPNAIPACGRTCGRTCSQYENLAAISCLAMPDCDVKTECDCKDGYVYDENIKKCVEPEQCSPVCNGIGEEVNPCANGGCGPFNCSDLNKPILCRRPLECIPGCVCQQDYLKDDQTGKCVLKKDCSTNSGNNNGCNQIGEVYSTCANGGCRRRKCSNPGIICIKVRECEPGCICKEGYVKNDITNRCILEADCPIKTPCGENEELSTCSQSLCRQRTCVERAQQLPIYCPRVIQEYCITECVCKIGFLRSSDNKCVPEKECDDCPDGERFNTCPSANPSSDICPTSEEESNRVSILVCGKPRCTCERNELRDPETKRCIDIRNCPPFECKGVNEVYNSCPSICAQRTCDALQRNEICQTEELEPYCAPKCVCAEGFYRNSEYICVKPEECSN